MISAAAYSKTGSKREVTTKLNPEIFGAKPNQQLVAQAYETYLANGRSAGASVLTRGLVRGGGRKPWRQKGTGRARVGSSRVPQWRGGGVTFGPTGLENHTKELPVKIKRSAIRQALSLQAADGKVKIVETFATMEGKTRDMAEFLRKIDVDGRVLCVVSVKDPEKERAARNIPSLKVVGATYLNVFDIMNADAIVISEKALEVIQDWLGDRKTDKAVVAAVKDEKPAAKAPAPKRPAAKKPEAAK